MMIETRQFSFSYGNHQVLRDLRITINTGTITALLGLNGAGKSTLLGCLSKRIPVFPGTIFVKGKDITAFTYKEYAKMVCLVPQLFSIRNTDASVRDYLVEGRTPYLPQFAVPGIQDYVFVEKIAYQVGIEELLDLSFAKLSGGQQQLVSFARSLVQDTPVILLDEPMSALDLHNQVFLLQLMKQLADSGKTVIFSTHNPNHAILLKCNTIMLKDGKVICQGSPDICFSAQFLEELYGNDVELIDESSRLICALKLHHSS